MTSLSSSKYFEALPSTIADGGKPVSTGRFRRLADNGIHLGDSSGRVLVNAAFPSGLIGVYPESGGYTNIRSFGPFALTVGPDGIAYPVRIRIAGSRDGKAGTVKFRVALNPFNLPAGIPRLGSGDRATETSNTSVTTNQWLTTTSTLLSLSAAQTARCLVDESTSDDGIVRSTSAVYKATIDVFGANVSGLAEPLLTAVYAAEFVGV